MDFAFTFNIDRPDGFPVGSKCLAALHMWTAESGGVPTEIGHLVVEVVETPKRETAHKTSFDGSNNIGVGRAHSLYGHPVRLLGVEQGMLSLDDSLTDRVTALLQYVHQSGSMLMARINDMLPLRDDTVWWTVDAFLRTKGVA